MVAMRLVAVTFAGFSLAAPAQATLNGICDVQLRINTILQFEDPEEGPDPDCDSGNFDTGSGFARGFSNFDFGGGFPPLHFTGAEITLTNDTTDSLAAQTFTEWKQGWSFSDSDPGRMGGVDLRVRASLNWNLAFGNVTNSFANAFVSYNQYDTNGDFIQSLGSFSCNSLNGAAPSCSAFGFDLSMVTVNFNGSSYDITGVATLDFNGGWVNATNNYFGSSFGTSVSLNGGVNGAFIAYGEGNELDWDMTSTEATVTVTPIPEPALASLLALALVAFVAGRRR